MAAHATHFGEKLRRGGLGTPYLSVFDHTREHDNGDPMRSVSTTVAPSAGSTPLHHPRHDDPRNPVMYRPSL